MRNLSIGIRVFVLGDTGVTQRNHAKDSNGQ